MVVSKAVFTCIKTKAIDNFQRCLNKGSDMPQSIEKQTIWKTVIFTFCLLQSRACDPSVSKNVSHSKTKFQARRNLRSIRDCYIYMVIFKPF